MDYRNRLFKYKKLYDLEGSDPLFLEVMKQNIDFHNQNCHDYSRILSRQGFEANDLKTIDDLHLIPPIPTMFYKSHELSSMPDSKMLIKSTTSGTSGHPTKIGLDARTCYYGAWMLWRTLSYHQLFSLTPANYIVLGYQPAKYNQMGAVKTAFGGTCLTPARHREYALKRNGTDYDLNTTGVAKCLLEYSKMNVPVRFVGFPSYFAFLLNQLNELDIELKLHPKSKILLGGGWKQFYSEQVDKRQLYQMVEETLGIPLFNIREFFGVVENNVLYCDCKNHHFHVPVYGRVLIRDTKTLKPVQNGTPGLLNLISPLVGSMPLGSIITDDIAVMHDGKTCGCGITSPYFEILGRVGMSEIKTCAAGANEMLGDF